METGRVSALIVDVSDRLIWPRFGGLDASEIEEKSPGDPVTVADREAEIELTAALSDADPGALVIGEEAVAAAPGLRGRIDAAERAWIIDPVDGTANFVAGRPEFGTLLVELAAGVPVRSWIWQAGRRRLFVCERGRGVRVEDWSAVPLGSALGLGDASASAATPSSGDGSMRRFLALRPTTAALSARGGVGSAGAEPGGRPLVGGVTPEYADLRGPGLAPPMPMTGSCTSDYPLMALGERDYLIHDGQQPWDHWPGILLLSELGGRVAFLDGTPFTSDAASLHKLLAARTPEIWDAVAAAARA